MGFSLRNFSVEDKSLKLMIDWEFEN